MKTTLLILATSAALLLSGPINAGGPVIVEEGADAVVEAEKPRTGWIVPTIIGLVVLCALACGGDDEGRDEKPTCKSTGGGCD